MHYEVSRRRDSELMTLASVVGTATSDLLVAAVVESAFAPLQIVGGDLLYLAVLFFVLALGAGLLGASGVAGLSMEIARILVLVFLVLAIVALLL